MKSANFDFEDVLDQLIPVRATQRRRAKLARPDDPLAAIRRLVPYMPPPPEKKSRPKNAVEKMKEFYYNLPQNEEQALKQMDNQIAWANMLENMGNQFQANANRAVHYGEGGNSPLVGGMAAGLNVVKDMLNAKTARQAYGIAEQKRLKEKAMADELRALREEQDRLRKQAELAEQRQYNERLYQQHYGQTRSDEDTRYLRGLADEDRRYKRSLADEDRRYNRNRQDQENTYQQHRFEDQTEKILPTLSHEDRMLALKNPGVERFAKTEPAWLTKKTGFTKVPYFGKLATTTTIPQEMAEKFAIYMANALDEARAQGLNRSDRQILEDFIADQL